MIASPSVGDGRHDRAKRALLGAGVTEKAELVHRFEEVNPSMKRNRPHISLDRSTTRTSPEWSRTPCRPAPRPALAAAPVTGGFDERQIENSNYLKLDFLPLTVVDMCFHFSFVHLTFSEFFEASTRKKEKTFPYNRDEHYIKIETFREVASFLGRGSKCILTSAKIQCCLFPEFEPL